MRKQGLISGFLLLLAAAFSLTACRAPTEGDLQARLARETRNIKSYHARMELRIAADGASVERYEAEQWHLAPDHYRVDVGLPHGTGQRFITDGSFTYIYEEELKEWFKVENIAEHSPRPPFLLSSYWDNVLEARQVTLLGTEKLEKRTYYLLEVLPRDANAFREKEIFWLDTKTLMPLRIETYDEAGDLRAELVFREIRLNTKLDMEVFAAEGPS
jgi:outer membrane lipoprotein-sorting protein